jgi:hypothetical protein
VIPANRQRNYFQSAVYLAIVAVLAAVLLERLLTYAEAAEKAAMEGTVARLNSALYVRLAYNSLRGEYQAIEAMRSQSPFAVTRSQSANYLGEFDGIPEDNQGSGKWLYDRQRSELVYLPNLKRHLTMPAETPEADAIRFRVELVQASRFTYTGVAIRPAAPYRWEPFP